MDPTPDIAGILPQGATGKRGKRVRDDAAGVRPSLGGRRPDNYRKARREALSLIFR